MAKVKNKKNSGLADKVHNKRKGDNIKKKLNPFEVHINKEKLKVLGKKSKHDRGLPGVSRAKAIQKRKDTLGIEMKLMNKTNTFLDRRIGEKNAQLTAEDKMLARFAAERAKQHTKKNIYNLADDEILTHRGQTLEQIEKFDDPRSDEEDDDNEKRFGGLNDNFVAEGHFGGGMLSRTDANDGAKSHKDLIEQLIAESKKRKAEKQKEKEQTLDLTEKLDSEWKDLQPVVFKKARVEEPAVEKELGAAEKRSEDYDKMMRELRFEKRGTPSDGLKSEEKQLKEEKERLEKLELEKLQRMVGDDDVSKPKATSTYKHRSADDLEDNFELEDEKQFMLAYDSEGKPLVPDHVLKDYSVPNAKSKFDDGISDTSSEGENDDESDDEQSEDGEQKKDYDEVTKIEDEKGGLFQNHETSSDDDNEDSDSSDEKSKEIAAGKLDNSKIDVETSSDEDDDDEISDKKQVNNKIRDEEIKRKVPHKGAEVQIDNVKDNQHQDDEDSEDESEEEVVDKIDSVKNVKTTQKKNISIDDNDNSSSNDVNRKKDDLKDLVESDDESGDEMDSDNDDDDNEAISYFDLKSSQDVNLKELLSGKNPSQQSTTLQKLIKSYDPGLNEKNKDLLTRLFAHMLQYVNDIFTNLKEEGDVLKAFLIFDKIAPHFYDLAHTNKVSSKKFLAELLKEKHDKFMKNPKKVPDLDTLIFFKLVSLVYPTSDMRHPVTTPSLIFMSEILTSGRFTDVYAISRGFFLVALILEYTVLSKKFTPSAINFLRGILFLSANISVLNPIQVVPPFKQHTHNKLLNLENDCSKMEVSHKMAAKDLVLREFTDDFKIRSLAVGTMMLNEFFNNYNDMDAQAAVFETHILLLNRIDLEFYPKKVVSIVTKTLKHMKESLEVKTLNPMCGEKKKPKALRLYEPDIQEVFTGSKSSKLSREQAGTDRLKHKLKREMKGALREIRRDKAYIGSVKIRQKIHSDNIRKDKVKQIYKDASIQQGELNKLKRMK